MQQLTVDEFFRDPSSIKYCCSKYNHFFVKSHNGDIIKSNLKIIKYENFCQLLSEGPNYGEHK